ncbi:MAG: aminotransferase class III-fold pyridoxal phosphate-dependent enzyme, partial [Leptospira sp.]|nr:aminotransferase class III-fold pyridoxal phosphate-dependent enzyme [Leptospira sp.]
MSNITLNNKLAEIKEKTNKYILGLYNRYDVAFKFGVGELLFDTENREYIDFTCGISVTNLGHSDADIIEALREQADKVFHTTNLFYSEEAAILAEAIVLNSFPGKVFFCNSGTEANEAAFKLSRKYALSKKREKPVILALTGSFHGRTASAMSMTGQEKIRTGYGELVPGFDFIEVNNEESLSATFQKHKGNVASLIMELIQGEVGIIPIKESFLKLARKLTRENDALLIFDEIQTGMGRT